MNHAEIVIGEEAREVEDAVLLHHPAVRIHPCIGVGKHVIDPRLHVVGGEYQLHLAVDVVEGTVGIVCAVVAHQQHDACKEQHHARHRQEQVGQQHAARLALGEHPAVLHAVDYAILVQLKAHAVDGTEQLAVVGHEAVFAGGHGNGHEGIVPDVVLAQEPPQHVGVPKGTALTPAYHLKDCHRHVTLAGNHAVGQAVVDEVEIGHVALGKHEVHTPEVLHREPRHRVAPRHEDAALGLRDGDVAELAVPGIVGHTNAKRQAGTPQAHVGIGGVLAAQPYPVRYAETLHHLAHKLHVETVGLALAVDKGIGPALPPVFVDEGMGDRVTLMHRRQRRHAKRHASHKAKSHEYVQPTAHHATKLHIFY